MFLVVLVVFALCRGYDTHTGHRINQRPYNRTSGGTCQGRRRTGAATHIATPSHKCHSVGMKLTRARPHNHNNGSATTALTMTIHLVAVTALA